MDVVEMSERIFKSLLKFFVDVTIIGETVHTKLQYPYRFQIIVLSNFYENLVAVCLGRWIPTQQIAGMTEDG